MPFMAASLAFLVYGMVASTWGTLNPTLGFNDAQNGMIAFAQAMGLAIASICVGPLIDRNGKKLSMVTGLALICASLAYLPTAGRSYTAAIVTLGALGFGCGVLVPAANGLASDANPSRRGAMLNRLNLFFALGGLLTPWIAANAMRGNAAGMCYLGAGLGAVALTVNIVTPMPAPASEQSFKWPEIGLVTGRPVLYLLALMFFLYVACEVGVWNWLAPYLVQVRGLEKKAALNILSLGFALGLLTGRAIASSISARVSSQTLTLAASAAMAATTLSMLRTTTPAGAWICVFCAGLAMAPMFPTTLAIVGDAFPRMTATAMGIVITCGWIGLAVSSPIIGGIAKRSSLGNGLLLVPVFSVALIVVNLALRPMLRNDSMREVRHAA